jgi:hypothetical protein
MRDAQKPDHRSLGTLLGHLKEGRFVIPDFQREFEWTPQDIRDLMRSLFLDYYIGSLLLWKGKQENFEALACEPIYGYGGSGGQREHIVLDGQQRLTAMYYAFVAPDVPAPNRSNRFVFFIQVEKLAEEVHDEAFRYEWSKRGVALLDDEEAQWAQHMFPLAVIGRGGWELGNWVQGYSNYWAERAENEASEEAMVVARRHAQYAAEFGELLKGITEQYQISYIELDRDLAIDKICDIFTQVNSKGVRLDVFDLMNALVKPKDVQLKRLWREAAPRLDFVESNRMNVYILQVMSILRQAYCSPKYLYYLMPKQAKTVREADGSFRKEELVSDPENFEELWNTAVDALERAIAALRHPQEFGAVASRYLPYVSIIPVFAALQEKARQLPPDRKLEAHRKLGLWYWASVFTARYSGSVESTAARDFLDVSQWFQDGSAEPAMLAEFKARFRDLDLRREVKRGTSFYNGVFNLLVLNGARDWVTGGVPTGDITDRHVVPKEWGTKQTLESSIDSILNRVPLTSEADEQVIAGRLPNVYLPELIQKNGESAVRAIFESHFISGEALDILMEAPFTPDHYERFLQERQRTILEAIESLLIKERIGLEPRLRELDVALENLELRLRALLEDELEGDATKLLGAVLSKTSQRISSATRRNPALDGSHLESLSGKLEFCDLRELQETLVSKPVWPLFADRFGTKDMLAIRFDQIAELRNSIRHNRQAGAIVRKDGEAALSWFAAVLEMDAGSVLAA